MEFHDYDVTHELCPGYMDRNAIWNNGFYCPRWGGMEEKYCCENDWEKFCCPEPKVSTTVPVPVTTVALTTVTVATTTSTAAQDLLPIVVGVSGGLMFLLLVALLACIFCPACPINRLKQRKPRRSVMLTRTISVSMEAEATSSVIASQAMSPMASTSTQRSSKTISTYVPPQTSPSLHGDDHLHCGCRWSPRTSKTAVVDIDNIVASMYQNTALPWQTELDNLYNCYTSSSIGPGGHGGPGGAGGQFGTLRREKSDLGPEHENLLSACTQLPGGSTPTHPSNSGSRVPTPLRLESFRTVTPSSIPQRLQQTDISSGCESPTYQQSAPRMYGSLSRDHGITPNCGTTSSIKKYGGMGVSPVGGGFMSMGLFDPDRQRRDSGVLVEEPDSLDSAFSPQDKNSYRNDIISSHR